MDEYDDWSPAEETDTPHIDLRRRVYLSGRSYEVSACGGGHDPVAVRVTGRIAGGYIVTDLCGDVLAQDLVDVADLLQVTLEGVAAATRRDEAWQSGFGSGLPARPRSWTPPMEDLPPNAGAKWTDEDLDRLVERHRAGATIEQLMAEFGRTSGGIRSRLQLLGESLTTQPEWAGRDDGGLATVGATADDEASAVTDRAGAAGDAGSIDDRAERGRFIVAGDVDDGGFSSPLDPRPLTEAMA